MENNSPINADSTPPKHIVAVSGLVSDPDDPDVVLLIRHPRRGWEFPGGQVEEGESLIEALARETREESGMEVRVGALVGIYTNVRSKIVMFGFLCEWTGVGKLTVSSESLEVEWVPRHEALARVTRPPLRDRLRDKLNFDGRVVYRSYQFDVRESGAAEATGGYTILEERYV